MLLVAFFVFSGLYFAGAVQSDIYGDLSLLHELQQEPYRINWDWRNPLINNRRAVPDDLSLEEDDSEREPLAKDYRDPPAASSEQQPVVVSKPKPDLETIPEKSETSDKINNPKKPITSLQGILPDGVVDVNADGFGGPLSPFNPDFDFTSSFGVNSKPFGFGDLFDSFQSNQWWKGKTKPKTRVDVEMPDNFRLNSFPRKGRPSFMEGIDVHITSPPIDLDLYADSEHTYRQKGKKFLLNWKGF